MKPKKQATYILTTRAQHNENCNSCNRKAVFVLLCKEDETNEKIVLPYCDEHCPPSLKKITEL